MVSSSQKEALEELRTLGQNRRQSVLIDGPSGCGKSYLSHQYANILGIDDYAEVAPKVTEIRETLDRCSELSTPVLISVENLDLGVAAASYTLLKSLEEPSPNVYLVLTCRNIQGVPDTIISRSAVVNVGPPTDTDIDNYGLETNKLAYTNVNSRLVWQCVRSFSDANEVLQMTPEEIDYYESLSEVCKFKDNVSNLVWKIGHYPSNKECNIELALRSIAELMHNPFVTKCSIDCIRDLNKARIAPHAILSKFVFNAKYCE